MEKAPAFQFYPKDWLDYKVMRMSYEAQGVYIRMLCHIWKDTPTQYSIKNNSLDLSQILGIKEKKFLKIFQEIQREGDPIFQEMDGMLISKRLRKEKEKQDVTRKKRQEAAASRWCKSNANAKQKQCSSSSTASSPSFIVPYRELSESWNRICASFPKIDIEKFLMSKKRKNSVRLRYIRDPTIEYWEKIFTKVEASSFCKQGNWMCFDWIFKNDENYQKVAEGNYDDKKEPPGEPERRDYYRAGMEE